MATGIYDINIYNPVTADRAAILEGYEYLEFTQRINSPWNHIVRLEMGSEDSRLDFFRNVLTRDYIVEIYRKDPKIGVRTLAYEGLHRTLVDQVKHDGTVVMTMYGVGYSQLLDRRVVIPMSGETNSVKSGPAETVLKDFVREQLVSPVDVSRVMPGFSIEFDQERGNQAEYSARYTRLSTVINRVSEQGDIDFGVVRGNQVTKFTLIVKDNWGTDRRFGNGEGNIPVIFDISLDNMAIPIYSIKGSDEVNRVYVGGQGIGLDRSVITVENTVAQAVSPWGMHESFVDARRESTEDALYLEGDAYLSEHEVKGHLEFNVRQTDATRWQRDWNLGDLITARYFGVELSRKITQITAVASRGDSGSSEVEIINVEMEDV